MQKFQACKVKILVLFKQSYRPIRTKVCGFIGGTSSSTCICDCWTGLARELPHAASKSEDYRFKSQNVGGEMLKF
jgi:hypothetical protein